MKKLPLALFTCFFLMFSASVAISTALAAGDIAKGEMLYKKCISCHAADAGKHGLNKLSQEDFIKEVVRIRDDKSGNYAPMKNIFKTYSEQDMKDLAAYVHTLKK